LGLLGGLALVARTTVTALFQLFYARVREHVLVCALLFQRLRLCLRI
jgi:hypothetical protein